MITIEIIIIFSFMKDIWFLNVHNDSWTSEHTGLLCSEHKPVFFPLNLIFCSLLDTDRSCPSLKFFRLLQTMLPSVTVSPRLTEERSEMKEEVLGSVPNDLSQHLTMGPLLRELCA